MVFIRKCAVLLIVLVTLFCVSAQSNTPTSKRPFSIEYASAIYPGDPLLVSVFSFDTHAPLSAVQIRAEIKSAKRTEAKASFFPVSASQFSALIPLSTFLNPDTYTLIVNYDGKAFEFPLTVQKKDFISETIELNAVNTAIRTDNSPTRATQIDRLNEILYTIDEKGVWETRNFRLPVISTRRTSFFGDRRVFMYSNGKKDTTLHYGVDFGVPTGTAVFATGKGRVVLAENRISTGWSVVIEHLPGMYSLYYHLDSLNVLEGQIVDRGYHIGKSGATGLATGPHLHWEIRVNGEAVNPDFFLSFSL